MLSKNEFVFEFVYYGLTNNERLNQRITG